MLSKEKWLKYITKYLYKYTSKYVKGGGKWIKLCSPEVEWGDSPLDRLGDRVQDIEGNYWYIREELDIMFKNGKVKCKDELPKDAIVVDRR